MTRLWLRAIVAFVVMDALLACSAAISVALGFRGGQEFGGAVGTGIFVAFIAIGYCAGALAGAILPGAVFLRRRGWAPNTQQAIVVGAALAVPAFFAVVIFGWLLDGAEVSLVAYFENVLRFPRSNLMLMLVFALGGAIVLSGLVRNGQRSFVPGVCLVVPRSRALQRSAAPERPRHSFHRP